MLKKIYNEVTREWDTSVEEALKSFYQTSGAFARF